MNIQEVEKQLREIRSCTNCRPINWIENEISRLLARIERDSFRNEIILEMFIE